MGTLNGKSATERGRFDWYRQGFEALHDGRMKGINTTTFRPLITPFEAVVKVERKTSCLVLPLNFVTFYDQKKSRIQLLEAVVKVEQKDGVLLAENTILAK